MQRVPRSRIIDSTAPQASVDIAEIQLEEEESETCYSLVFWAPPETSNADKDKDHGAKVLVSINRR